MVVMMKAVEGLSTRSSGESGARDLLMVLCNGLGSSLVDFGVLGRVIRVCLGGLYSVGQGERQRG